MKLTRTLLRISYLAAFIGVGQTAHADTFTFNSDVPYFGGAGTGTGTLTAVADPILPGAFDVTGISGTVNGIAITGLLPCATYDPNNPCVSTGNSFFYDNLLYPGGVPTGILVLDFTGIGFALGNGGLEGSFSASSTHQYAFLTNDPHDKGHLADFSISPVPEPSSLLLLGTGVLGIASFVRRRIRS